MKIVESLRNWFRLCPLIDRTDRFNVNYLGEEPINYSIEDTPGSPKISEYMDGNGERLKNVVIACRDSYGKDILQNISSSGFWEELIYWVDMQNVLRQFPDLGGDIVVTKVAVTTSGYIIETDEDSAKWQMQMQIIYYKKAG